MKTNLKSGSNTFSGSFMFRWFILFLVMYLVFSLLDLAYGNVPSNDYLVILAVLIATFAGKWVGNHEARGSRR